MLRFKWVQIMIWVAQMKGWLKKIIVLYFKTTSNLNKNNLSSKWKINITVTIHIMSSKMKYIILIIKIRISNNLVIDMAKKIILTMKWINLDLILIDWPLK